MYSRAAMFLIDSYGLEVNSQHLQQIEAAGFSRT